MFFRFPERLSVVWTRRARGVKLVEKFVTRQRSSAKSTGRNIRRPPWRRIKGDSQPYFVFVEVSVLSVLLLAVAVGFWSFHRLFGFFELLSLLRKDEDHAV